MNGRDVRPVVLLTGAGSGIGRGAALAWARRGATLVLAGRTEARLLAVADAVRLRGGTAYSFPVDIGTGSGRERLRRQVLEWCGGIDVLVCCAGEMDAGRFDAQDDATIASHLAINLHAPLALTGEWLPVLRARRGTVVLVGSTMSYLPLPGAALYSASKMGLRGFAEAVRPELAPARLLLFCPPATATAMTAPLWQRFGRHMPGYRLADAEQVGERLVRAVERRQSIAIGGGDAALALLAPLIARPVQWLLGAALRASRR